MRFEHAGRRALRWGDTSARFKLAVVGGAVSAAVVAVALALTLANRNESSSALEPAAITTDAAPVQTAAEPVAAPSEPPVLTATDPAQVTAAEPLATEAATSTEPPVTFTEPPVTGEAPDGLGGSWSFAFFSEGAIAPSIAGYTCDGLFSTWHVIFAPGSALLERTYDLPFTPSAVSVHHDLIYDFPPDNLSPAIHVEWRWDYQLDPAVTPPLIRISGTQHQTPEGGSESVFENNFGTGEGIQNR